jgi:Flp pilus assembly secretin CpaC
MRRFAPFAVAALAAASVAAPATAAPLVVPIDQFVRLNIPGEVGSVLVPNPAVVDYTTVDSRTIYVFGKGYGATDLVVLDRNGQTLFSGEVVVTGSNAGRVSVYRGSARTDMACAPGCQVTVRSAGGGAGAAPASPGGSGGSPVAQAVGAVTGAP